jgi:NAD(P)-dependent dehydrogenase (short-subunit alcohol dehydrogenase family)
MGMYQDKIAVVTGGASGIGKALARQLLDQGARVVIADVEAGALETAVADLGSNASGIVTDVSSAASVESMAARVFDEQGGCDLLFNNAGVAAPSANVWETTVNDWAWVHGVNVMGVIHGIQAFVPRMIAAGKPGHVINTSSGDGGISPLPFQSVYASSKAAVSIITECLGAQLISEKTNLQAHLFYPSGGLLDTGIWTTDRNRPADLAREKPYDPVPTVEDFKAAAEQAGMELLFQDLDDLAKFALTGISEDRFILMIGTDGAEAQLTDRAQRYGRAELPLDLASIPQL